MIIDFGYYSLIASLALSVYIVIACLLGIRSNSSNLIRTVRYSFVTIFLLSLVSYGALTYAFAFNDFSVKFVAEHSSTDLPMFYKVTAVWGGMDGSLLLWQFVLSIYSAIVVVLYHRTHKEVLPHTMLVLGAIAFFLLFMLVGWSNPMARLYPVPAEGQGLNPLLQNLGMVYHPPTLYLGFIGFTIPFAFAMGSLLRGRLTNEWIVTTRRWSLVAWYFLSLGLILGGEWAYVELGWGGYWAWDPVENSSLMPWLSGTAFLHSVIVQEKRNSLKIWNIVLIILTFTLTFIGTFITRSGVLNSVHAFAKSPIGPAFLVFVAVIVIFSLVVLFYRQSMLESKSKPKGILCKENAFLINNVLFVGMSLTVLYGTVFPLLAEGLANKKLSIQAPFFNSIMTPLAIVMIILLGITHTLGWNKTSREKIIRNSMIPGITSLVIIAAFYLVFEKVAWQFALLAGSSYFAGYNILVELVRSFKRKRQQKTQNSEKTRGGFKALFQDRRRRGSLIIHLGIVVIIIGICGTFFGQEQTHTFYPGDHFSMDKYTFHFKEVKEFSVNNTRLVGAEMEAFSNDDSLGNMFPAKSYYPTRQEPMTEIAIKKTLINDLYMSLSSVNRDGSVTINIYINPLVTLVWASMIFFTIGIIYSLSYKSAQITQATETKDMKTKKGKKG